MNDLISNTMTSVERPRDEAHSGPGCAADAKQTVGGKGHAAPSYTREDLLAAIRALAPRLRAASDEIEAARTLTEPLVQAMADAGLYRMYLPRSLGGGELDPLAYFDVIERLHGTRGTVVMRQNVTRSGIDHGPTR